jgi:hypothetical protein
MKYSAIFCVATLLASTSLAQNAPELKDEKSKVSYSIGLDIGNTFKKQGWISTWTSSSPGCAMR